MIVKLDEEVLDGRGVRRVELFYINEGVEAWRLVEHGEPTCGLDGVTSTRRRSIVETSPTMAHIRWHEATLREPRSLYPVHPDYASVVAPVVEL